MLSLKEQGGEESLLERQERVYHTQVLWKPPNSLTGLGYEEELEK